MPPPARRVRFQPAPTAPLPTATKRHETRHVNATGDDDEDEMAALRDAQHPVLQWDLEVVRWLMRLRETTPALHSLVVATTSKVRTQDFSLILWLVFFMMVPELGLPYLWICTANLLAVLLLQWLAQVLRPLDVDPLLLRIPACTDPDTYGFPCVDSHMAVVVLLPVVTNTSSAIAQGAFVGLALFLSATRLFLGARFVTQVVGSWLSGIAGIIVGNHGHLIVKSYKLSSGSNTAAIVSVLALLLVVMGHWVEHNDSRVLGVPKADFMEVLTNILHSDGAATTTTSVHQLQSREDQDDDDDASDEHQVLGKKDSFYYLLRGMRARARGQGRPPASALY